MDKYKNVLWAVAVVLVCAGVMVGSIVGGAIGYFAVASDTPTDPVIIEEVSSDIPAVQPEPAVASPPATMPEQPAQPSASGQDETIRVGAVERALPAVVTVRSGGARGVGSGSGFFISENGYVVTNNHVVEGASEMVIIYADGGTAEATLIGTAPEFDLAVIQVDGPVPAILDWGDSSALPLGADVIAIGSALGQYRNTVTAGILSGFNRELGGIPGLLQTDAAINSGNSGGPLLNKDGQVIGINTLVVRGDFGGAAQGLGFAIPSNIAETVTSRLIESGEVRAPFLGINYQELNPQLASEEGLSVIDGALLLDIVPDSPASQAGLEAGDVIISIDGTRLDDRRPLVSVLLEYLAGDTVTIEVLRDGSTLQTTITLAERA